MRAYLRITLIVAICLSFGVTTCTQETSWNELNSLKELFKTHSKNRVALWVQIINKISQNKKVRIAEIGVWKGHFAYQMLKNCPNIEKYYLVDPWRHLDDWKKPLNVGDNKFNLAFKETMRRLEKMLENALRMNEMQAKMIEDLKTELGALKSQIGNPHTRTGE